MFGTLCLSTRPSGALRRGVLCAAVGLVSITMGGIGPATAAEISPGRATVATPSSVIRSTPTPIHRQLPRDTPVSREEAARFLMRASYGPTSAEINSLMTMGYGGWIQHQFSLPATSHRAYWEAADAVIKRATPAGSAGQDQVWESFWKQAVNGDDQLRQRMVFALSQLFVVSAVDNNLGDRPRALAAWLDMLGDKSFGTYRDLLEAVSLHPMMGLYLNSLRNQKADANSGRVPDENYAREVMQLFSIGVIKLNLDGTPTTQGGMAVETYTPADVTGIARVFTGWSWACPLVNANCFNNGVSGSSQDPDRDFKPMMAYPQYHSAETKSFLGTTISSSTNPAASLKAALDTLAAHPNTAPFISKQLIQRLVTSNPSPAYVQAVAQVFNNNGLGLRGDLKAVLRAILTHPEALQRSNSAGKLREPVLRLAAYLRAFPHSSYTGGWKVGNTDSTTNSLGQTPLRAGSVFNFYRPGYVAPGTQTAAAGLLAPELQILNETSVAGWVNYMRDNMISGVGQFIVLSTPPGLPPKRDLQRDWSAEIALAANAADLVNSVATKLLGAPAAAPLHAELVNAVTSLAVPTLAPGGVNQRSVDAARRVRVNAAVLLVLATPEFLVQK